MSEDTLDKDNLIIAIEALLLASQHPMSVKDLRKVLAIELGDAELKGLIGELVSGYEGRVLELVEVASGYRFQIKAQYAFWAHKIALEKPARYSRALLETLALVAYRQPITRAEIEAIRGVSVSSSIFKTLLEDREWIRVVGHREVPGRPALYATTKGFLDYFGLKSLEELPSLVPALELERDVLQEEHKSEQPEELTSSAAQTAEDFS